MCAILERSAFETRFYAKKLTFTCQKTDACRTDLTLAVSLSPWKSIAIGNGLLTHTSFTKKKKFYYTRP